MDNWKLGNRIMRLFRERDADSWGNHENPNHGIMYQWYPYGKAEEYLCAVLNEESPSDQVWLGSANKWFWFYSGKEFRRLALWVLWRWVWHDWCGLKTKLWLIGLHLATTRRHEIKEND